MADTFNVKFINVGRNKRSWDARIARPITEHALVREIRNSGALMSRDVGADFAGDSDHAGYIFAGVRPVGQFVIECGSEDAQS